MRAYNPLSVDERGQNAARALMSYPAASLPPEPTFDGAGLDTIHYGGPFEAYRDMTGPIYVGKADPPGKRQGRSRTRAARVVLHDRRTKHARFDRAGRESRPTGFLVPVARSRRGRDRANRADSERRISPNVECGRGWFRDQRSRHGTHGTAEGAMEYPCIRAYQSPTAEKVPFIGCCPMR